MLMTQLPAVDGHCAFLIARLNSNPSWEEGKKKVIHRLQTDRSGHLLNQPLEHFHAHKKARCQNITSLIALSDG